MCQMQDKTEERRAAELLEVARAVLTGELARVELVEVSTLSMSLRVKVRGVELFGIASHEGGWVLGSGEGRDLMAMLKEVAR